MREMMQFELVIRRCKTLQTLSVDDGLTEKPIYDCVVLCGVVIIVKKVV